MARLTVALPLSNQVQCGQCGSLKVRVIDTRRSPDGSIYRRRHCLECNYRITTQEMRVYSRTRHVPRRTPRLLETRATPKRAH